MNARTMKRVGTEIFRFVSLMLIATLLVNSVMAAGKRICSVVVEPQEKGRGFVTTFAHPFKKGDVKDKVVLKVGNEDIGAQVNVMRRYLDGSVKHAIISAPIRQAEQGKPLKLDIYSANERRLTDPIVQDLPKGFSAEVVFRFPDGVERSANAAEFYRKATSGIERFLMVKWLEGPLIKEVQLAGPPRGGNDNDNTKRTAGLPTAREQFCCVSEINNNEASSMVRHSKHVSFLSMRLWMRCVMASGVILAGLSLALPSYHC